MGAFSPFSDLLSSPASGGSGSEPSPSCGIPPNYGFLEDPHHSIFSLHCNFTRAHHRPQHSANRIPILAPHKSLRHGSHRSPHQSPLTPHYSAYKPPLLSPRPPILTSLTPHHPSHTFIKARYKHPTARHTLPPLWLLTDPPHNAFSQTSRNSATAFASQLPTHPALLTPQTPSPPSWFPMDSLIQSHHGALQTT